MTEKQRIIAVDVDDVCADLTTEWLNRYNNESGDSLTPEKLTGWEIDKQLKPGWRDRFYEILHDPEIYESVKPYKWAPEDVSRLKALGRVIFVTSSPVEHLAGKLKWLIDYGFLKDDRSAIEDYIPIKHKWLIRADVLLDDHVLNVERFVGNAFLVQRHHNLLLNTWRKRIPGLGLNRAPEMVKELFSTMNSMGI